MVSVPTLFMNVPLISNHTIVSQTFFKHGDCHVSSYNQDLSLHIIHERKLAPDCSCHLTSTKHIHFLSVGICSTHLMEQNFCIPCPRNISRKHDGQYKQCCSINLNGHQLLHITSSVFHQLLTFTATDKPTASLTVSQKHVTTPFEPVAHIFIQCT
jgi:hypothetical protein